MHRFSVAILFVLISMTTVTGCQSTGESDSLTFYDFHQSKTLSAKEALSHMQHARIVLVGEHHTNTAHHQAQLNIIQALHRTGRNISVGLEMFRQDSQQDLNRWVSGQMSEAVFKAIYLENWNYDWSLYRPIFLFAREHGIPLVGLNVPRGITSRVARQGFESLSDDQRGALEGITCDVTDAYRQYINRAHRAHGHGGIQFERFCEAQLVWDAAMAIHALDFLTKNSDHMMILLAGSGHARKMGIPAQIEKRTRWPYLVILPETKDVFEIHNIAVADADLLVRQP